MAKGGNIQTEWGLDAKQFKQGLGDVKGLIGGALPVVGQIGMAITGLKAGLDLAAGAFRMVGGAINAVVGPAMEFQTRVQEIKSLGVNKSIASIGTEIDNLTMKFGQDAQSTIKGYYDSISAGVDESQIIPFLEDASKLATVGVTDIGTAVDGLTSVLNAYGETADKAGEYSDFLFKAVQQGKTTIPELAEAIGRVAPTASAMGIGFKELAATISTVTAKGLATRETVTGLKAALSNVVKPTMESKNSMALLNGVLESSMSQAERLALGIGQNGLQFDALTVKSKGLHGALTPVVTAIEAARKRMEEQVAAAGGLNNVNAELREKYLGIDGALSNLFGSIEGYNAVVALASEGGAAWKENLDDIATASGIVNDEFSGFADTTGFKVGQLRETWTVFKKDFGELFIGAVGEAATVLQPLLERLDQFLEANKGIIQQRLGDWFQKAKDVAVPAIKLLKEGYSVLASATTSFLQEKVLPVWKEVDTWIQENFGSWAELFDIVKAHAITFFTEYWNLVKTVWSEAWDIIKYYWQEIGRPFFLWLDEKVKGLGGWKMLFESLGETIKTFFGLAAEAVKAGADLIISVIDGLKTAFETFQHAWKAIGALFQGDTETFLDELKQLWDNAFDFLVRIWDRISDRFEGLKDVFEDTSRRISDLVRRYFGGSIVPDEFEKGRKHLEEIWSNTISGLTNFGDRFNFVIEAIARKMADDLHEHRIKWIEHFGEQNDIMEKGFTKMYFSMGAFQEGNKAFFNSIEKEWQHYLEFQKKGTARSTELWQQLYESAKDNINGMSDRFGFLRDKAEELFGIDLRNIMDAGVVDFGSYMQQFMDIAEAGSGMFDPVVEAIETLTKKLDELFEALDAAVGHSWMTDLMQRMRDIIDVNFISPMQEMGRYASIGVGGIEAFEPALAGVSNVSTDNSRNTSLRVDKIENHFNSNGPLANQNAGEDIMQGLLRQLRWDMSNRG